MPWCKHNRIELTSFLWRFSHWIKVYGTRKNVFLRELGGLILTEDSWEEGEVREKIAEAMILSSLSRTNDKTAGHPELSGRGFIHAVLDAAQQQGTIRRDTDAWDLTGMVGGFITVSVLRWSRNPRPGQLNKQLKRCLKLFLEGAKTEKDRG